MSYRKSDHLKRKHRRIDGWSDFKHPELTAFGVTANDIVSLEHAIYGQIVPPEDADYDLAR